MRRGTQVDTDMNINIYYGGRGMIDDPTLYVINKMEQVLEELHVKVQRYNLYELKNQITTLPQTLKSADGVILATTVEWYGIGGYLQQFLDACWLYGDKEKISNIYMCPVVMSTTYGEREGKLDLAVAWEILGGLPCSGMCGYIADTLALELNDNYNMLIEKKAENIYRTINQKFPSLPASNQAVKQMVATPKIDLTPQESEQLSHYVADDGYVQRQKEDIQELANLFRDMMGDGEDNSPNYIGDFTSAFVPQPGVKASYLFQIEGKSSPLLVKVNGKEVNCQYAKAEDTDVQLQLSGDILNEIVKGKMSFQRAFMTGGVITKGDFKILRMLDQLFVFNEK